ncbi:unnamed protein product [Ceutorhynchus assimilis]|uniref:Uncharacterized protein n=1 Tax=Ceutorhynchus assimilis TaxID=467358 RepID=A0A9N9MK79_9CUCU|nr:unnamed protein product [Ceutorhynchus assimilis]
MFDAPVRLFPFCSLLVGDFSKIMKTLVAFLALVAIAYAYPGGLGGGYEEHGKATAIIHGEPVITRVFKNPGLGHFDNYAPKIEGPLKPRGIGPHVDSGRKGWD